ncbi:hypothetical protein [Amycolatopsis rubida]|uniref:Uncharacterized protein n=1 Tax=Amycolatopsis rubida TaxID=112413 RepID=A0A1I5XG42_9PSEU|nr:hypothetical protein [Amycolatopsis rubida]SFQ30786.1 hypothetical protein SAMN05421854_110201 [Amycolatopsis rubida]
MQLELPDDVMRLVRLSAAIAGETPEEWASELVRRHVDTEPMPRGPLLIESPPPPATAVAAAHDSEPAPPAAAGTEHAAQEEPKIPDDTALVLDVVAGSKLLNGKSHVRATELLALMAKRHDWPRGPKGHGRLSQALSQVRVHKESTMIGDSQVKTYPAAELKKAVANRS